MAETIAEGLVRGALVYLAVGVLFAPPFVVRGIGQLDPVARDGSLGFRLIVIPGVVALWPVLLLRWLRGTPRPTEDNAHRAASRSRPEAS